MTTILGIDPGIVHTGCVSLTFPGDGSLQVMAAAFPGTDTAGPATWVYAHADRDIHVYVESYRARGNNFGSATEMQKLLLEFRQAMPGARILDNTGVKKVVTRELMELFGVWKFSITTHHQDLRSAARIALYGALKDDNLNQLLYRYAIEQLFPEGVSE